MSTMSEAQRSLPPSRVSDDPVALELVWSALQPAGDDKPPTVEVLAETVALPRLRVLDALAFLVDAGTVRGIERPEGGVGFSRVAEDS